jgi:xylulokinase
MNTLYNPYLLGIDLGTSGLKCVLIDRVGQVVANAYREYMPQTPRPGWVEQPPDEWLQAAISAVREVVASTRVEPASIAGLGLSGQMHSTVLLDRERRCLRPAILWLDQRSLPQVDGLHERFEAKQLAAWLGNPVMPGFTVASLLWLKDAEPEVWHTSAQVLLPKDYVRLRLTGELATDYSDASATGLFDVEHRAWSAEWLHHLDIPIELLPPLRLSTDVVGRLLPDMAQAMGLSAGLPVVCGAGDQAAQAVGNRVIEPGQLSSTIGTGGQLLAPINRYRCDEQLRLHTFCHAVPELWHWEAATLTAGMSLRWLRDEVLEGRHSYQELADAATTVEPGAEDLIFLPYLSGERTPHMDPSARGVFHGLTLRHTWREMARAVMEGVVFALKDGLDLMRDLGLGVARTTASGGGVKHPLWLQLQADVFGVEVTTTQTGDAAAFGAALLAGAGVGVYESIAAACHQAVKPGDRVYQPRPGATAHYQTVVERYRQLYRECFGQNEIRWRR